MLEEATDGVQVGGVGMRAAPRTVFTARREGDKKDQVLNVLDSNLQ